MARSIREVQGDQTVHYVPMRKQRSTGKMKMQPPMTPMIDVTFQLLLFFLLTTTFRQAEGNIPGSLPDKGHTSAAVESVDITDPIRITIRPTAERITCIYELSGDNTAVNSGPELFRRLLGRIGELSTDKTPVIIQPRADVQWQHVVEAYNQAVRAKFKNIAFAG